MVTEEQAQLLLERGWPFKTTRVYDFCWLDCNKPGLLKMSADGKACICLCMEHALVLEEGLYGADYRGAPLPPESMADEWPWRSDILEAAR